MLIVETIPKNAGKFIVSSAKHTLDTVKFKPVFYDSIEDAITDILKKE